LPVGDTAWARGRGWALWKTLATWPTRSATTTRRPRMRDAYSARSSPSTRPAAPSRRTLAVPRRCIDALRTVAERRASERAAAGSRWHDSGLVFTTKFGTALDAADVRRDFRTAMRGAEGMNPKDWTPRELLHSFVSLLSDNGLPIDEIARSGWPQQLRRYRTGLPPADPTRGVERSRHYGPDLRCERGLLVTHPARSRRHPEGLSPGRDSRRRRGRRSGSGGRAPSRTVPGSVHSTTACHGRTRDR
jgi:hypothetical protein